jgi:hypothetical protein
MLPPLLALRCFGNGLPLRFVLDLRISEELMGFGMEENGVVVDPVFLEDRFQLWPDWRMAMLVLLFFSRVNRHYKSLADSFHEFLRMLTRG